MKAALFLLLLATPAAAGSKFITPKGCTAFVTVQHSNCQVSNHYTCDADPKGDQWSVYADADGPNYVSHIDAETRWVLSFDPRTGDREVIDTEKEPASFSSLLKDGYDDYDFTTRTSNGVVARFVGRDTLTGKTQTIDGVTLEQTEFTLKSYNADRSLAYVREGHQFISRDWRLFFAGDESFTDESGAKVQAIEKPVTFSFPGDAGFLSQTPKFGCNEQMTQGETPFLQKVASHE